MLMDFNSFGDSLLNSGLKIGSSALNGLIGNSLSKELFDYQQARQEKYQKDMLRLSPLLTSFGLKSAGYNINFADGASSSAPSVPASPGSNTHSDFSLLDGMQIQNMKAQTKLVNEQARAQKIANDRLQAEDDRFNKVPLYLYDGALIGDDEFEKLSPQEVDQVTPIPAGTFRNKGSFDHYMRIKESSALTSGYINTTSKNRLERFINENKLQDDEVLQSLVKLPSYQLKQIQSAIDEVASKIGLNKAKENESITHKDVMIFEKEYKENHDMFKYVEKLFNNPSGFKFEDIVKTLLLLWAKNGI